MRIANIANQSLSAEHEITNIKTTASEKPSDEIACERLDKAVANESPSPTGEKQPLDEPLSKGFLQDRLEAAASGRLPAGPLATTQRQLNGLAKESTISGLELQIADLEKEVKRLQQQLQGKQSGGLFGEISDFLTGSDAGGGSATSTSAARETIASKQSESDRDDWKLKNLK